MKTAVGFDDDRKPPTPERIAAVAAARFVCTECDARYKTFVEAMECHKLIGGVENG